LADRANNHPSQKVTEIGYGELIGKEENCPSCQRAKVECRRGWRTRGKGGKKVVVDAAKKKKKKRKKIHTREGVLTPLEVYREEKKWLLERLY